jgi:hypothetical protein
VVLADGLGVPVVGLEEGDRLLVTGRHRLVDLFEPVRAGPLQATLDEVTADAVVAVLLQDPKREFGGVVELLEFGHVEVDPPHDLVADAGDEEHPFLYLVVTQEYLLVVDDVGDRLGFDVGLVLGHLADHAHQSGEVGLAGRADGELDALVAELLFLAALQCDAQLAVEFVDVPVPFEDRHVVAKATGVDVEFLLDRPGVGRAGPFEVLEDVLPVVVVERDLVPCFHGTHYRTALHKPPGPPAQPARRSDRRGHRRGSGIGGPASVELDEARPGAPGHSPRSGTFVNNCATSRMLCVSSNTSAASRTVKSASTSTP